MPERGFGVCAVFLADYFVNPVFRREILRVLNRGEATNALKRLIYTGRAAGHQAKSQDEMQAVADALSLLGNIGEPSAVPVAGVRGLASSLIAELLVSRRSELPRFA